jgi:hypothetical protein
MRGKLMFGAGLGVGYVLGTRAGRQRFDQIMDRAKQFKESKTVRDAATTVQEQAGRLYEGGKQMVSDQSHRTRTTPNGKNKHRGHMNQPMPDREQSSAGQPANTSY